jgi:TRAP-type C4-dicarboxylate transport system permease small subunit
MGEEGTTLSLSAACLVVCIEMLSNIFRYSKKHLPDIYPAGAKYSYGTCFVIAWLIFFQLLISSFIFFACSRKRKSALDEATEEEASANRQVNLGRSFK